MRFKLLNGNYFERNKNGKRASQVKYEAGSVIESERELDKLFQNKFERLADIEKQEPEKKVGRTRPPAPKGPSDDEDGGDDKEPVEPRPLAAKHKGGGRWDVYNTETGKKINDSFLTKAEAFRMAEAG